MKRIRELLAVALSFWLLLSDLGEWFGHVRREVVEWFLRHPL